MPIWTSSLTTMLIDGAPMPLVAHTTGRAAGQRRRRTSRGPGCGPASRPSVRCSRAISSDRPGSPLSRAIDVPSGRSSRPNPTWYIRPAVVMGAHRTDAPGDGPPDACAGLPDPYPGTAMSEQIPLVDYLVLGDDPHLVANECTALRRPVLRPPQRLRRRAAAPTSRTVDVATEGEVRAFTIVSFAAPGRPGAVRGRRRRLRRHQRARPTSSTSTPDPEHVHARHEGPAGHLLDRHRRRRHRGRSASASNPSAEEEHDMAATTSGSSGST